LGERLLKFSATALLGAELVLKISAMAHLIGA
jgi:hypothetical protein